MPYTLLSVSEMRAAENAAIGKGVSGFTLMERAGQGVARIVAERFAPGVAVVLAGPGNNGGDGFIIAAALEARDADIPSARRECRGDDKTVAAIIARPGQHHGHTRRETFGQGVARIVAERFAPGVAVVLAGPGNNGGDGFIIAAALAARGWDVSVACLGNRAALQGDAAEASARYRGKILAPDAVDFTRGILVIDALFGTGLTRPLEGAAARPVERVNAARADVVAVDIASGVLADSGAVPGPAIRARLTVTFAAKKPATC